MLNTELRNPKSMHIDKMPTLEMVELMNEENMVSVLAVEKALPLLEANDWNIRKAVESVK